MVFGIVARRHCVLGQSKINEVFASEHGREHIIKSLIRSRVRLNITANEM